MGKKGLTDELGRQCLPSLSLLSFALSLAVLLSLLMALLLCINQVCDVVSISFLGALCLVCQTHSLCVTYLQVVSHLQSMSYLSFFLIQGSSTLSYILGQHWLVSIVIIEVSHRYMSWPD